MKKTMLMGGFPTLKLTQKLLSPCLVCNVSCLASELDIAINLVLNTQSTRCIFLISFKTRVDGILYKGGGGSFSTGHTFPDYLIFKFLWTLIGFYLVVYWQLKKHNLLLSSLSRSEFETNALTPSDLCELKQIQNSNKRLLVVGDWSLL